MTNSQYVTTTRDVYDHAADQYAAKIGTTIEAGIEAPIDRAALTAFVEIVSTDPGIVADIGCGPGRVAAFLLAGGLETVGTDVSQSMLAVARRAHPRIRFELGTLNDLPFETASLRGAVCWYSIIHTPPTELALAFTELARVLQPGGDLLLAFQSGDNQAVTKHDAYGSGSTLTNYRHSTTQVAELLLAANIEVSTTVVRQPIYDHESTPQAFLFARSGRHD